MSVASEIVRIASSQVGVKETGGNNEGPEIVKYQCATNLAPGSWPWCAAFTAWVLREALKTEAGLMFLGGIPAESWRCKSAAAFHWIQWAMSEDLVVFDENDDREPRAGDFMVFDFSHIGIVESYDAANKRVSTIEGNTGEKGLRDDATAVDGVMRKSRTVNLCRAYIRVQR